MPEDPKLFVFGQGVGADAALQFTAAHPERAAGLMLESVWANRKAWLRERFGPVIGSSCASLLSTGAPEPENLLPAIRCPLLLIRPEKDQHVRTGQWQAVLATSPTNARHYVATGRPYLGVFADRQSEPHDVAERFLLECRTRIRPTR